MRLITREELIYKRSKERLEYHYNIEKDLASRLKNSSRDERSILYNELYDELFRKVSDHPQLVRKNDPGSRSMMVSYQMTQLKKFLKKDLIFMEIGPGDCSLSIGVAKYVKKVFAIDVSSEITKLIAAPKNLELIISDGSSINIPPLSVDLAYSNQLMEHLHPDDAKMQLANIYKSLKSGGHYICNTPNRLSGPHDISKYFSDIAEGFHLKEYTYFEMNEMLKSSGFKKIKATILWKNIYLEIPITIMILIESFINRVPNGKKKKLCHFYPVSHLLGISTVSEK